VVYLRTDDGDGEDVGEEAGAEVCCAVAPEGAVALDSTVEASFAASARANVGVLHSSKKRAQLRSGVPVVRIAWLHFFKPPSVVDE
jgi:hypothetical protein